MPEKTGQMLAKLRDIENFHFKCDVQNPCALLFEYEWTAHSAQPSRHKSSFAQNSIAPYRGNQIVDNGISPFHQ